MALLRTLHSLAILFCLLFSLVTARPQDSFQLAADRVSASVLGLYTVYLYHGAMYETVADEGKEAFSLMQAAVSSADERVRSVSDELSRAISKAVSKARLHCFYRFI